METSTTIDDFGNSAVQTLVVILRIIQIRVGAFNEVCEVEAYAKYNVANNSHYTFCFNSVVESLAYLFMKTL